MLHILEKQTVMLAPAKVNLFLHVLGKRDDGFHDLQSLMAFADFGDEITIAPADTLRLTINGVYARALDTESHDTAKTSSNILIKALWTMAAIADQDPKFDITLTKNIPLGAGLGGGSADAAALIRMLCALWDIDTKSDQFKAALFQLGADVPACFYSAPCHIIGTGENIFKAPKLCDIPALLIHPNKHCSTKDVFAQKFDFSPEIAIPEKMNTLDELVSFLKMTRNDLLDPACALIPEIENIRTALKAQNNILFSNMSGSGSACFGIFETSKQAHDASHVIKNLHPEWWVQAVTLHS